MKISLKDIVPIHNIKLSSIIHLDPILYWLPNNKFRTGISIDWDVYLPSKGINLQRPFVWTLNQKQEFIKSVLKGIQILPMLAVKYTDDSKKERNSIYKIIDGKQRFSTLIDFASGKFHLDIEINGENKKVFIDDLDDKARYKIDHYTPEFIIHYEYQDTKLTDEQLITLFESVNFSGTPQDIEHLNNLKK